MSNGLARIVTALERCEIWIPRRAPNLNDLLRAKSTVYGKGKVRTDAYAKLKESWAGTVAVCARAAMTPRVGRCAIHFAIVEMNRKRDPDGICSATSKLVIDGLVKAGVLAGDGWDHIAGLSFSWSVGDQPGVLVRLTELAEKTTKGRSA